MMAESDNKNILASIRDNLLKPMAADIKSNTDVCGGRLLLCQKKISVLLWILLVVAVINLGGIIIILSLLLK